MDIVRVRNVVIGNGRPKICVPIVSVTQEEILEDARELLELPVDIAEWRADWYEDVGDLAKVLDTAKGLRECLGDIPLLFTFRTAKEGGEKSLETEDYVALNKAAAESGFVDMLDVELFTGDREVMSLIEFAHQYQVRVIVSSHDFRKTPSRETILGRLRKMQELGADIPKIAVMPQIKNDVLALLAATVEMSEQYARVPIITMSMAGTGVVSRLAGECFGSAVTYGSAGKQSAPGQVAVEELSRILNLIHDCQENG